MQNGKAAGRSSGALECEAMSSMSGHRCVQTSTVKHSRAQSSTAEHSRAQSSAAENSRFRAKREHVEGFEGFSYKPRPEYGLDCLICAMFA